MKTQKFTYFLFLTIFLFKSVTGNAGNYLSEEKAETPFVLISDIDNTLKITDPSSSISTIYDGVWGQKTFAGMRELFLGLNKRASHLVYLSEAPISTLGWIQDTLLKKNRFPNGQFELCNWWSLQGWTGFKQQALLKFSQTSWLEGLSFLMFGDDTRQDIPVYLEFRNRNLEQQENYPIYIHRVLDSPILNAAEKDRLVAYYTAFEPALYEMKEGRLTEAEVIEVGEAILESGSTFERIIPDFAACPTADFMKVRPDPFSTELSNLYTSIQSFIIAHCQTRSQNKLNIGY